MSNKLPNPQDYRLLESIFRAESCFELLSEDDILRLVAAAKAYLQLASKQQ